MPAEPGRGGPRGAAGQRAGGFGAGAEGGGERCKNPRPGNRLSQVSSARSSCVGLTLKLCLLKTNRTQTAGQAFEGAAVLPGVVFHS